MRKLTGISTIAIVAATFYASAAMAQSAQGQSQSPPEQSGPGSAAPEGAGQASGGIADIIVTAQRRSESVQKTALSVTVVQPAAIANAGITNPTQLTSLVPALQVSSSGPATSVYLRGVGGYSSTAGQSPAVPFYIDGVYVARPQSVSSEFYDIERLEVLKGPQGTLYGRNASGGAINVITRDPGFDAVSGDISGEFGNYSDRQIDAALNIPLSSTLAARASGTIVDKGGYTSTGFGDDKHESARLKMLWKPSSDVSLLLNGSYGHIGGVGPAWVALNKDVPGWYPWLDASDPRAQAYQLSHSVFGPTPPPGFVRPSMPSDGYQNLSFYNISADLSIKLGGATLSILPAYRYSRMQYTVLTSDLYANGLGLGTGPEHPETSKATSLEVRLSGNSSNLKYVIGGYFYNEDQTQEYLVNGGYVADTGFSAKYGTRSYAAFGQLTYSILPNVRLIGGLRYTSDRRSIIDGTSYLISPVLFEGPPILAAVPCAFPAPTKAACVVETYAGKQTAKNVSWKGGVEADVFDNSLFYATASRGFKAGGFNTQSTLGQPGAAQPFKPEILTAYEVGLKNRFLDNKVQLNLTTFYWDYKNHQEPRIGLTNVGSFNLIYDNAGTTKIYGAGADLVTRPWRGGTIGGSVEYVHSRYENYVYTSLTAFFNPASTGCHGTPSATPGITNVDCSGFPAVKTPKFVGNINVAQDIPLGDGHLTATANMNFASRRYLSVDLTELENAPSYVTVDASLTYSPRSASWSVAGFVRNLNNGKVYTQAQEAPFSTLVAANINAPRTYGARLSYHF